jgi:hypothetical protein
MATAWRKRISSASISARRTIGSSFSRAAFSSGLDLLDRRRDDDDFGIAEIFGLVADEAPRCPCRAAAAHWRCRPGRTLHLVAEIVQHFGNAAHADAADADEMHKADGLRHLHARVPFLKSETVELFGDAIASVRSASNRAASGLPADFAAAAIAASRSGSSSARQDRWRCARAKARPADALRRRRRRKGRGIGRLVVVERMRVGHQNGRAADDGDLRHGRGAGTRDHQMRRRDALAMSVKKGETSTATPSLA